MKRALIAAMMAVVTIGLGFTVWAATIYYGSAEEISTKAPTVRTDRPFKFKCHHYRRP